MKMTLRLVGFLFLFQSYIDALASDASLSLRDMGEKEFLLIKAKSTLPRHGQCWHNALRSLKTSCDKLNDREHSQLALRLTDCFLEDSGHRTYSCFAEDEEAERRKCLNNMSDRAFGVYNEFYTHTTNICYFLNHEIWRSETDDAIQRLYQASARMNEQLLEASEIQGAMLASQKEGLKLQNELLEHGQELGSVIKNSAETVTNMVIDFRETSSEQRELLQEIFSNVRVFENWVIGEVSWFQSIIFYCAGCLLCALLTSSQRTADARIVVFVVLSSNVVIERMLVRHYTKNNSEDSKIQLSYVTWMFRKAALSISTLALLFASCLYKDKELENLKTLRRIECRLESLQLVGKPIRYSRRLALRRHRETEDTNSSMQEIRPKIT